MKIVEQRILTADEGLFLTDGKTYGKTVVIPANADHSVWREVTEEELPITAVESEAEENSVL